MKLTLIGLTISLVSFGLGYWIGQMKPVSDGLLSHARGIDLQTDSTGRVAMKEDFGRFIYEFSIDSSFQMDRIKFPLKSARLSVSSEKESFLDIDTVLVIIERKDWRTSKLFGGEQYQVQTYDNFRGEMRDTDERLISWGLIKNGRHVGNNIECRFSRIGGIWYLIEYNEL